MAVSDPLTAWQEQDHAQTCLFSHPFHPHADRAIEGPRG